MAALYDKRDSLGLTAEQVARPRPLPHHLRARRREARAGGEEAARRDHRAAREPRHAVLAERARRREVLSASFSTARRISPACRPSCARPRRRRRRSAACRASTSSRSRAPASSRSCNSRSGATCASRPSRPGRRAATTAAPPTTRRSSPRWWRLRAERAKLLGYETFADFKLADTMAKTPGAVLELLRRCLGAGASPAPRRERDDLQAQAQSDGRQHRHRAVGLALLCRAGAHGATRSRRGDDQAVLPARPHHRGGVRHGAPAVRAELRGAEGFPALSSRHPRLAGDGCERRRQSASSSAIISRAPRSAAAPG